MGVKLAPTGPSSAQVVPIGPKLARVRRPTTAKFDPSWLWLGQVGSFFPLWPIPWVRALLVAKRLELIFNHQPSSNHIFQFFNPGTMAKFMDH